ncbi:MAG: collagenase-like protease [Bacteroidetes bacterium]|nr:MAG: collagenase-like protease [Bacteroidota bacterium]
MEQKIEIMAPVGSWESLTAAIQGGADAIYFGVGDLNMRSRSSSQNFTTEDLKEITARCEAHNVKTYLALNAVIYGSEIEKMKELVDEAVIRNISAIIATDISVISYARSRGMRVHISTQTNVSNIEAVQFYAQFAEVIVLARELTLTQVKAITDTIAEKHITGPSGNLVEIEMFVHGALCMAISGKCYLSLDTYGPKASGNRGACYQLCRRPYQVFDRDREIELAIDNEYIMSPKDLKTIEFLDQILDAGVKVLKIEGRGRSADYVKTVTQCYKEAVTAWQENDYSQEKIDHWNKQLSSVFNRGFWEGYYLGRKMGEWTERYGNRASRIKKYVGSVTNYFTKLKVAEIKLETDGISVGDNLVIIGPTTGVVEHRVEELRVEYASIPTAPKGVACSIPSDTFLRRSDKVYKMIRPVL